MRKIVLSIIAVACLASCAPKEEKQTEVATQSVVDKGSIVVENILNRRSVRSYKPEQVSKDQLDTILKCAINAPSANNKQPWEVRVVQNADILAKIKELGGNFHGAPTMIVVAKDKNNAFGDFDSGLLTQNILLSAHSLDLGTCALGSVARLLEDPKAKDIKASLNIPDDYYIVLAISLGIPNESPEAKPRETAKVKFID